MKSKEFYEGYHSFKCRLTVADCPYKFQPALANEWKSGFSKAKADSK